MRAIRVARTQSKREPLPARRWHAPCSSHSSIERRFEKNGRRPKWKRIRGTAEWGSAAPPCKQDGWVAACCATPRSRTSARHPAIARACWPQSNASYYLPCQSRQQYVEPADGQPTLPEYVTPTDCQPPGARISHAISSECIAAPTSGFPAGQLALPVLREPRPDNG